MSQKYDLDKLWEATNNGLTFFQDEFATITKGRTLKGFSVRSNDKTGSANVFKSKKNDLYLFKDFGLEEKAKNAVDYVMSRDNCDFLTACGTLFRQYGLEENTTFSSFKKPRTEFLDETKKPLGYWNVSFEKTIKSKETIKKVFPFYDLAGFDVLREYNFKEIKSYENVGYSESKNALYHRKITATNEFPIFGYDYDGFVKIYQPEATKGDKFVLKHSFLGEKPNRIIYGWDRLLEKVDLKRIIQIHEDLKLKGYRETVQEELDVLKLDSVIIATGGSDGINIASLGYNVIWFNSETETINLEEYNILKMIAKNIYYVPDLDITGVQQAVKLANEFIDVRLVWLPEEMKLSNKKDFADWVRSVKNLEFSKVQEMFKNILKKSLNFRFWQKNEKNSINIDGKKMINFLKLNDFYRYRVPHKISDSGREDDGFFLQIRNNQITQAYPSDMRLFILNWLENKNFSNNVYNKFLNTTLINQNSLKTIPYYEHKKMNFGKDFQYYFFENKIVKVTKDDIISENHREGRTLNQWEEDFIPYRFSPIEPFFKTYTDEFNRLRVNLLNKESNYMKVLINTSRIFWQKDALEDGNDSNPFGLTSDKLTEDENYLQETHFLNKMYCVGYLLHQYKSESLARMVLGVDYNASTNSRNAKGGTGKSFLQKSLRFLLNTKEISGKSLKDDNFPMDGVTPRRKLVIFDDLMAYQDYQFFYTLVTGNFVANQKGGVKYDMPFDDAPKIGATTNYPPELIASSKRRLLLYHNSDYYHVATDRNNFPFSRSIADDFKGKNILSKESIHEEMNADFNFMLQCLQLYLSQSKPVEAPLENLIQQNYLLQVGQYYKAFFDDYFEENNNIDKWIEKPFFVNEAKNNLGRNFRSSQELKSKLMLYCKGKDYFFEEKKIRKNPYEAVNGIFVGTKAPDEEEPTSTPTSKNPDNNSDITDDIAF